MAFTVSSKHKVNIVQGENYFSHDLSNCTFELQKCVRMSSCMEKIIRKLDCKKLD